MVFTNNITSPSHEMMADGGTVQETQNTPAGQHGLYRLLRRRGPGTEGRHARTSSVTSLDRVFDTRTDTTLSHLALLQKVLTAQEDDVTKTTYGVTEMRDGFFDAVFFPPEEFDADELLRRAEATLPYAFRKKDPLSVTNFLPKQWHEVKSVARRVTTTRAGIKLLKSFLAFFVTYVLCLVPRIQSWLGRYSYVMVVSAIINHPGRTLGAQVDGAIATTLGTATGLGWGAFGLWLSTVTATARLDYGAILAAFLFIYIFAIACIRSYYIRTYQLVLCAGISISYTCLAEVAGSSVSWSKLLDYGVPWVVGQAVALTICATIAPDAGARPLAVALHQAFGVMLVSLEKIISSERRISGLILTQLQDGLNVTSPDSTRTHRRLAQTFVNLSQAYRDLVLDFSITLFKPEDVRILRNRIQGVVRALLGLRHDTKLFEICEETETDMDSRQQAVSDEFVVDIGNHGLPGTAKEREILKFVADNLAEPTKDLISAVRTGLQSCDAVLMDVSTENKLMFYLSGYIIEPSTRYDEEQHTNLFLPNRCADTGDILALRLKSLETLLGL